MLEQGIQLFCIRNESLSGKRVHHKTVWVIPKERFLFKGFTVIGSVRCIKTG